MKLLRRLDRNVKWAVALAALMSATAAWAQGADKAAMNAVGRTATPAEVHAWNIDVRGDFKGLPKGSGSVDMGAKVWDGKPCYRSWYA